MQRDMESGRYKLMADTERLGEWWKLFLDFGYRFGKVLVKFHEKMLPKTIPIFGKIWVKSW